MKALMLDKLRDITIKMQWLRPIAFIIMLMSLAVTIVVLFTSKDITQDDYYLLPAFVTTLWSFSLFWVLYTFPNVPEKPCADIKFFKRVGIRFKRFMYYLITIIALVTSLGIVLFTTRALRVWLGDFN